MCSELDENITSVPLDQNCVPENPLCTIATCDVSAGGCVFETETNCCGNNIVEVGEECDDGNNLANDGCSPACTVEEGWKDETFEAQEEKIKEDMKEMSPEELKEFENKIRDARKTAKAACKESLK